MKILLLFAPIYFLYQFVAKCFAIPFYAFESLMKGINWGLDKLNSATKKSTEKFFSPDFISIILAISFAGVIVGLVITALTIYVIYYLVSLSIKKLVLLKNNWERKHGLRFTPRNLFKTHILTKTN